MKFIIKKLFKMEKSIYKQVSGRGKQIREILDKIISAGKDNIPFSDYNELEDIDQNEICLEIDQFVKEYPATYEKYLPDLLKDYSIMKLSKNNYISEFLPEKDNQINDFFWSIDFIVDHLEYTLKLERHRFIDLLDRLNSETKESTPQLSTKLSYKQREDLFNSLVKDEFISETDKESFIWAFGKVGEVQPLQWKPIKWMEAKQGLRELLTSILGTITNQYIRVIESLFIGKDCKPYKMSKDNDPSARCREIETIVKSLNIENIPTSPDPV